jgi:hypothetical protein
MQDFGENKPHKSDLLEGSEEESGVAAAAATAADRELFFFLSCFLAFLLSLSLSLSFFFSPRSCTGGDCDKECFLLRFLSTVCFVFREHDDSRGGISVSILFVMILGSYSGFHSFKARRFGFRVII